MFNGNAQHCQDEVVLSIAARLERYAARANEEYNKDPATFANDITRQEAAIMNIVRAVTAALDIGEHLIRKNKLGAPISQLDVIDRIVTANFITTEVADNLKKMIVFRNAALHQPQDIKPAELQQLVLQQLRFFFM